MKNLVWFRRDLRISDNPALFHACKEAREGVIGIFVITPQQWLEHDDAAVKVQFWLKSLVKLSKSLEELNIPLLIQECDSFSEVPDLVLEVAETHDCSKLFFNREYEVNESQRDSRVSSSCESKGISVHSFHDRCIVPPEEISTKEGQFYRVFTPYRRVWDSLATDVKILPRPAKQLKMKYTPSCIPDEVKGFDFSDIPSDRWPAGEQEARQRLSKFLKCIRDYDGDRDIPSTAGTSQLSPYLAAGVISARTCYRAAAEGDVSKVEASSQGGSLDLNPGVSTWISELTWRDFYMHVLVGFPRVSKHRPFKLSTEQVGWRRSVEDFEAWKQGRTGYPIVDAGMRQLNQTGWMHNRLRMVTAMFLTKQLLVDWRWGERYFMKSLIDGDLASNNGGWQWSASTGTDAVPYFRIFNPFSQSKRFDPDGKFIKKFCPELAGVPAGALHDSDKLSAALRTQRIDYPAFVVDHKQGRDRALAEFKEAG